MSFPGRAMGPIVRRAAIGNMRPIGVFQRQQGVEQTRLAGVLTAVAEADGEGDERW